MRISLVLFSLLFAACAATTAATSTDLRGTEWTLVSIEGFASLPSAAATPTIHFDDDGRFSGNSGCNSGSGTWTATADQLTLGSMAMTRRACAADEANQLERAWVGAVEGTRRYRVADGRLELLDADGRTLATFRASS